MAGQAKLKRMIKEGRRKQYKGLSVTERRALVKPRVIKIFNLKDRLKAADDRRGIWRVAAPY